MSEIQERHTREVEHSGVRWRAVEAWRGRSGHALCYQALDDHRLDALFETATALTETERRILDAAGAPWLAQASGPVWAEGGAAAGLAGVVFTRLQGPFQRLTVQDDRAPAAPPERLLVLLERARTAAEID